MPTCLAKPGQNAPKCLSGPANRPSQKANAQTIRGPKHGDLGQPDERVRDLNDQLRKHRTGGWVVMTRGIAALGGAMIMRIDQALRAFDVFTSDNDPHGEHDFGTVQVEGHVIMFKIDTYDLDLRYASLDPADPNTTCRVMMLILTEEY
jgi:hypothetical protein